MGVVSQCHSSTMKSFIAVCLLFVAVANARTLHESFKRTPKACAADCPAACAPACLPVCCVAKPPPPPPPPPPCPPICPTLCVPTCPQYCCPARKKKKIQAFRFGIQPFCLDYSSLY